MLSYVHFFSVVGGGLMIEIRQHFLYNMKYKIGTEGLSDIFSFVGFLGCCLYIRESDQTEANLL